MADHWLKWPARIVLGLFGVFWIWVAWPLLAAVIGVIGLLWGLVQLLKFAGWYSG
jgi:hypothetical protein